MPYKKPRPLNDQPTRTPCPVCGEISYSLGGVHPQCAVRRADEKRLKRTKKTAHVEPKMVAAVERWQKICPKCKASQHVRKKICDCGHQFATAPKGA